MNDIETALADVRKAYRLVYLYQKRSLDIVQRIAKEFQCEFYFWTPIQFARPCKSGTFPSYRWVWDMLPMYDVSFLFLKVEADHDKQLLGDWMLEVRMISDSGYNHSTKGEPDPINFLDVEKSHTRIQICFYYASKENNFDWYYGYWNTDGEYPEENVVSNDDEAGVKTLLKSYDWSEFTDESSIAAKTNEYKQLLKESLQLDNI